MKDVMEKGLLPEHCGRKLTFNMVTGGALGVLSCIITIFSYPVYLHFLGYAELGLWMVLSTFVTLCQLGSLGIAPAVSRLVAEEFGAANLKGAQEYAQFAISAVGVLGTITICILFVFRMLILRSLHLSPETTQAVQALLPLILMISFYAFLTDVFGAVLTGLGRMDLTSGIQVGSQAVAFGCSSVLLVLHQRVMALAIGMLISLVLVHILTTIFAWRVGSLRLRLTLRPDWTRGRRLSQLAYKVFATSMAASLFVPLNKLLLSRYVGLAAVPVYDIAFTGSMRIRALFEMPVRPIMPALSSAISSGTNIHEELNRIRSKTRYLLLAAGLTFGLLFLFSEPVLRIWLRRAMDPALPHALRLTLLGAYVSLLGVPAYYALLGLNRAGALFWSHIVQSATNAGVVLTGVLIGYQVSLRMLLLASAMAMGASTCFLALRYRSSRRSLGGAARQYDDASISDVSVGAARP